LIAVSKYSLGSFENLFSFFVLDCLSNNLKVFFNNNFKVNKKLIHTNLLIPIDFYNLEKSFKVIENSIKKKKHILIGKGFTTIFFAVGLTMWVELARIVRGQILSIREKEYIIASRALGYSNFRIIWKHIFPNILGPVVVICASNFYSPS
jgi:ABC-type dipeptide/oligopeptide/nickel transport system permease component